MTETQKTMPQVVHSAAEQYGDKVALVDRAISYTYKELEAARLQAARAFIAQGISKGDCIAIWAPNIPEWIIAAIGLQSVGAVLLPLNTRLKGAEAAFQLRKSGAKMLFTLSGFLDVDYAALVAEQDLPELNQIVMFRGDSDNTVHWSDFMLAGNEVDVDLANRMAAEVHPDDPLDMLFTSGTTGEPKGVVTSHGQNIKTFEIWSSVVGLNSEDNYLIINPFFHSFGYKAGWLSAILRGAKMLPIKVFDIDVVLERIEKDKITMLPGAPTIYQSLLVHPKRKNYDLSSLRLAVTGAASVPVELVRQMSSELGFDTVLTAYGLTETCGVVSICREEDGAELIATTSGRAMPDVEVKCVDSEGNEVPRGEPGEVLVRGFNVMQGYFDLPEETANTIDAEGWLHTGDVAIMNEEGYIAITDRIKDMFITGGFNCYPAEIENSLCSMKGVAQAAVIGVPDERMGEVAKAFIVQAEGADLQPDAVIAWCRENMANYKAPRYVELIDAMPLNASGKVLKTALRARAN